jgi:hypothetical protein
MTTEQEKLICDLYQLPPGLGLVAVARLANTSVTTVRRVLREAGIKLRPVGVTLANTKR